jgi:hypothetical protein
MISGVCHGILAPCVQPAAIGRGKPWPGGYARAQIAPAAANASTLLTWAG